MINPLNLHYSFNTPATVHDEEALTSLELAGRQGAKINEIVKDQNNLRTETENKIQEQNSNIQKMKDETIPEEVKQSFDDNLKKGTFTEMIDESLGGLSARVDNLLGNMTEGSTTMDAEIIDSRVDASGVTWKNMGSNIRSNTMILKNLIETMGSYKTIKADHTEIRNGFYTTTGEWYDNASYFTYFYNVSGGDMFVSEGQRFGFDSPDAVLLDSNGNFIQSYHKHTASMIDTTGDNLIIVPEGNYILAFPSLNNNITVYKVTGFESNAASQIFFDNMTSPFTQGDKVLEDVEGNRLANYIITLWGLTEIENQLEKYDVMEYTVENGAFYYIKGNASYNNLIYAFYDASENILSYARAEQTQTSFNGVVLVPVNAVKMRVANEGYYTLPEVKKVVSFSSGGSGKQWNHLKWCCMGDSLTEENIRTDKHYHTYVSEKTGIQVVNMGLSGSGYMRRQDEGLSFVDRITSIPHDCDVVTIFGSGNDLGHINVLGNVTDTGTDTICGCVNRTIDLLYSVLPTVQLGVVSPTPWNGNTPDNANASMTLYSNALKEICERRGIPFLDLYRLSGYRPNDATYRSLVFSKDPEGVANHPNELGHKIISSHFYNFLNGLIGTY